MLQRLLGRLGYSKAADTGMGDLSERVAVLETRNRMLKAKLSGLPPASGVDMTYGAFEYEANRAFKGKQLWKTIEEMLNDPAVKEALQFQALPLLTAQWNIEPASDSEIDIEAAQFAEANLLRRSNDSFGQEYWCRTPWLGQRLPETLDMLASGFSMFAKSTREVNGKIVYDRIQWLEPSSVDPHGWKMAGELETLPPGMAPDDIYEVQRTYGDAQDHERWMEPLSAARIALFVWELKGARYMGRPFQRSMYSAWFRKGFMQKISAVWVQKVGAPSPIGSAPSTASAADMDKFEEFVQQQTGTASTDSTFVGKRSPSGEDYTVAFAGANVGDVDRVGKLVTSENTEISRGGMMKSRALGETAFGSRALGQTQGALESLLTQAIGIMVCEFMTHGVGGLKGQIEELHEWNYGSRAACPKLTVSKLSPYEGLENVDTLINAKKAGMVPNHPDLSRQIVELSGFNLPDDAYDDIGKPPPGLEGQEIDPKTGLPVPKAEDDEEDTEDDQADDEDDDDDNKPIKAEASIDVVTRLIAPLLQPIGSGPPPNGMSRHPNRLEVEYVNLSVIQTSLDQGPKTAMVAVSASRESMITDLVGRVRSGKIAARHVETQSRSKPRAIKKLSADLMRALRKQADSGRVHVAAELTKMESASPTNLQASRKKKGRAEDDDLDEMLFAAVLLALREQWQRYLGETLEQFNELTRQGIPQGDIATAIDEHLRTLSVKPEQDIARRTARTAYSDGRGAELLKAKRTGRVTFAVRSELLDDANTCAACVALDGTVVDIGSPEYYEFKPPAKCQGGHRCRGEYIGLGGSIVTGP